MREAPLTPQELAELQSLQVESGELSPEEAAELAQLEGSSAPAPASQTGAGGALQTGVESFGNSATMGYLPQIQAALEPALTKAGDLITGQDQYSELPDYVTRRDQNIERQKAQSLAHPTASMAGTGAGIAASALVPGGAIAKGMKGAGAIAKMGAGAAQGAATGALYNPGDEKGVVNPIQAGERAGNAAIGGIAGGALAGAGAGVSRLAEKHRMIGRVKDSAGLSKHVKGEIDSALNQVSQKQIAPRADKLAELLKGKSVEVNPDRLKGVSKGLDGLANRMEKNVNEEGRRQMSATRAQRLKQLLDGRARYGASKPFDNTAVAKGESAQKAADIVRRKLSDLDPGVGQLNDEMGEAIRLRETLRTQSANAPISSIRSQPGTDKGSLIDSIDKMASSKLERLSGDIEGARKNLFQPENLTKPLLFGNEIRKGLVRGVGRTARAAEPAATPESLQAILQTIYENKR